MSLGNNVDKNTLDYSSAQAAINLRDAFNTINKINQWLENNPVAEGVDPLVGTLDSGGFGYTDVEASTLRNYFSTLAGVYTANEATFVLGSEMTGLQ